VLGANFSRGGYRRFSIAANDGDHSPGATLKLARDGARASAD
jgi:hypothetical protein